MSKLFCIISFCFCQNADFWRLSWSFFFFFAQSYLEWQLWVACFTTMSAFALPRHDALPFNVKGQCIVLWGNCNTLHLHLFSRWHLLNYLSCFSGTNVVPICFHWIYVKPITILKKTVETTNILNTSRCIAALAKVCCRIWLHETRYKRSWQVQWKNMINQIAYWAKILFYSHCVNSSFDVPGFQGGFYNLG